MKSLGDFLGGFQNFLAPFGAGTFLEGGFKNFLRFLRNFFGFVFVNGVLEPGVQVKMVGLAQFFAQRIFARERSSAG